MPTDKTNSSGVPILSTNDIELKAEEVIQYFNGTILDRPVSTPLLDYVKQLGAEFGLVSDYSLDLGSTANGNKILGKTQLDPLGLFIDVNLANDRRFKFALGHELGHVVLHRHVDVASTGYQNQELVDTEYDIISGKKILSTARDWLEWQANRFASAIVMPRATVRTAVIEAQSKLGIQKNQGSIYLEAHAYSMRDYMAVSEHLQIIYGVCSSNVECRLRDLEILIDRRDMNIKHVSDLFSVDPKTQRSKTPSSGQDEASSGT